MRKCLIGAGLALLAAGLAWPWLRRLPFGRLPGDLQIVRAGFIVSFPIVICIVVSIVLSLLLWLVRRSRGRRPLSRGRCGAPAGRCAFPGGGR